VPVHGFGLDGDEHTLLRGPVPRATRAWVRDAIGPGARILSAGARSGGTSSAIHSLTVVDRSGERQRLVLRRFVRADWLAEEPDLAEHEALVLALLERSDVLAPRLVAVDPDGTLTDVPAVLMTALPGRVRWSPRDLGSFLGGLVDALLPIHAVRVPAGTAVRRFRPYYAGEVLQPPAGTRQRAAWERAIEIHAQPPPGGEAVFIHRDFHPGNVLWAGDAVTGVVDWASASVGSPLADVAHCRANLARHLGWDAAEAFRAVYEARAGRTDYDPYWDLMTIVGMLDDSGPESGWLPASDEFVARVVAGLPATR
jgi:aminoglycoside phosphotransferase (APT) family kinase protein